MSEGDTAELLSDELTEICTSDSLSEEGLREIIERFGVTPHNDAHINYDFFIDACQNEKVTEAMIRDLIEYFPDAPRLVSAYGDVTPLHVACDNKSSTTNIIHLLIEAFPDSVRHVDEEGNLPIHYLCSRTVVDEKAAMELGKCLLALYPESIRHTNAYGTLPLHDAAFERSTEFCRILVQAYPDSVRVRNNDGKLPLHHACMGNSDLPKVEYLYNLYPDAINHATRKGHYPIHDAVRGGLFKCNETSSVAIVKFLLQLPGVKEQKFEGKSLLHFACRREYYSVSTVAVGIQKIKALYDEDPKAIEDDSIASNVHRWHEQVQAFVNGEMVYARQARDHRVVTTPDENGQLPLHRALQSNARLGSIKLLMEGNHSAARSADNNGSLPLHLACQYHESTRVIDYLIDFCPNTLQHVDIDHNTSLHYACRGAKYDTIAMLLEQYNAGLVSMRNVHNQLPIDMLFESNSVADRESVKYTDCLFRLLRAYPETYV